MLSRLLQRMSGTAVAEAVGIRHDAARESYRIQAVIDQTSIETLEELKCFSIAIFQNQYKRDVLEAPDAADLPEHMAWGAVRELLEKKYAGGLRGALRAARLGVAGGIRGIAELVYEHLRDEHIKAYRKFVLENEVASVDWDARVAVAREFLRSLSCVVPKEQQVRAEELAPRLEEIIEAHIERTSFSKKSSGR